MSDAAPVFERIVDSARRILNTNYVNIGLIGDDGLVHLQVNEAPRFPDDPLYPQVVEWLHRYFPAQPVDTIHAYAAKKRTVLHYPDVLHGPDVPPRVREVLGWMGEQSQLWVPLVWNGQGIGAFGVARVPVRPFSDKEIALIKTFADQAVIAIQNAKMFRETNEALERQTATAEILKVIASSPSDVQPVFDAIARSSNQLLGGWSTMVARIEDDALQLVAFTSTTPEGDAALRRSFPIALQTFPVGAAIRRGEMVPIVDTELVDDALQNIRELARARGYRSMLFLPAGARGAERRHDQRHSARTGALRAAPGRAAADLCRPGGDRHRERAPVQRDAGVAAAAEGVGRGAGRHQQLDGRRAARVREDPRQLPSTCSAATSSTCCWSTSRANSTLPPTAAWRATSSPPPSRRRWNARLPAVRWPSGA